MAEETGVEVKLIDIETLLEVMRQVEAFADLVDLTHKNNQVSAATHSHGLERNVPSLRMLSGTTFEDETEESIRLCVRILTGLYNSMKHEFAVASVKLNIIEGWLEFGQAMLKRSTPSATEGHLQARKRMAIKLVRRILGSPVRGAKLFRKPYSFPEFDQFKVTNNPLKSHLRRETQLYFDLLDENDFDHRHQILKLSFTCFNLVGNQEAFERLLVAVFQELKFLVTRDGPNNICMIADMLSDYPSGSWAKLQDPESGNMKKLSFDIGLLNKIVKMYPNLLSVYTDNFDRLYSHLIGSNDDMD